MWCRLTAVGMAIVFHKMEINYIYLIFLVVSYHTFRFYVTGTAQCAFHLELNTIE